MQLKIMSLNLRYDKPDPGNNAWRVRREAVAALISHYAPNVIGTQEGKAHQLLDLHRLLPDYQSVGGDSPRSYALRAGNAYKAANALTLARANTVPSFTTLSNSVVREQRIFSSAIRLKYRAV